MKKFLGLLILLGLVGLFYQPGAAAKQDEPIATPDATQAASAIAVGAHLRPVGSVGGDDRYDDELADFNSLVAKESAILMYFTDWSYLDPYLLNVLTSRFGTKMPVIMLTWQPIQGAFARCNTDYGYGNVIPYAAILAGNCDGYIQNFANFLAGYPSVRFIVRFAHEFNITDTPWFPPYQNATPTDYVAAFRYVHDKFYATGITNAEWMWSPNYASNPSNEFNYIHNYWPGDEYVDWIGLSGYNWYNQSTGGSLPWVTFEQLYGPILTDLACAYAKPQILAEIGTVEGNGTTYTKSGWIQSAYAKIPNYPFVKAVVWFNDYAYANASRADFRITSSWAQNGGVFPIPTGSGAWTNAYRQAIAPYSSSLPLAAAVTPPARYCGDPLITVGPLRMLVEPGDSFPVYIKGEFLTDMIPLSLNAEGYLSGSYLTGVQLDPPEDEAFAYIRVSPAAPDGIYQATLWVGGVQYTVEVQVYAHLFDGRLPLLRK